MLLGLVSVECLAAFDCLQWLRTGSRAADLLNCNQSTVSRYSKACQRLFGVSLVKRASEWVHHGDDTLLAAERSVHQLFRWQRGGLLRLEAQHWLRDFYQPLPLDGWVKGNLNYLEYERPSYLLKHRIIDAWLGSTPDLPHDPAFRIIPLCSMPTQFCVQQGHPLLELGTAITLADVAAYPLLPLPQEAFPLFTARLEALGLGQSALNGSAGLAGHLPAEDRIVGIANPITASLYGPDSVVLPIQVPITVGDALVVHADFAEHPRVHQLVADLTDFLSRQTSGLAGVQVHQGQAVTAG